LTLEARKNRWREGGCSQDQGQSGRSNARYEDRQNKGLSGIEQILNEHVLNECTLAEERAIKIELLPSGGLENCLAGAPDQSAPVQLSHSLP
jgi:hypothetical protein